MMNSDNLHQKKMVQGKSGGCILQYLFPAWSIRSQRRYACSGEQGPASAGNGNRQVAEAVTLRFVVERGREE
jgi:hypothetical protein